MNYVTNSQFARFLITGGFAAIANFGSRFLFNVFFSFEVSVVLAFFVGLTTGYLLARTFVFVDAENSVVNQIGFYLLLNLLGLLLTFLVSVFGARWLTPLLGLEIAQASAHLAGIAVPVVTSFFGHKYLTFKGHKINEQS